MRVRFIFNAGPIVAGLIRQATPIVSSEGKRTISTENGQVYVLPGEADASAYHESRRKVL